jgi:DNA-binding MurR/RpiR family transcriptional regulator
MTTAGESLEQRIAHKFDELTPKQRVLARLILDNRYMASYAAAAELGDRVEASAATVIRLCQALGYEGLPDLQAAIRADLPNYMTAAERLDQRYADTLRDGDTAQDLFRTDIRNLQRTAEAMTLAPFQQSVDALAGARRILVIGGGVVAAPAHFLAYSLRVIGLDAHAVLDDDVSVAVSVAHVGAGDVVVAYGIWRYIASTVETLAWVRERGARTITITDSVISPLARHADFALETATESVAHSRSLTAMMSLGNALVAEVGLRDRERTRQALHRVDAKFKERGLLVE